MNSNVSIFIFRLFFTSFFATDTVSRSDWLGDLPELTRISSKWYINREASSKKIVSSKFVKAYLSCCCRSNVFFSSKFWAFPAQSSPFNKDKGKSKNRSYSKQTAHLTRKQSFHGGFPTKLLLLCTQSRRPCWHFDVPLPKDYWNFWTTIRLHSFRLRTEITCESNI